MSLRRDNDPRAEARYERRQKHPVLARLAKLDVWDWQIYGFGAVAIAGGVIYLLVLLLTQ